VLVTRTRLANAVSKRGAHNPRKAFIHAHLPVPTGGPGCLSIFGRKVVQHRLFAEHLTAEYRVRTKGRGDDLTTVAERANRISPFQRYCQDPTAAQREVVAEISSLRICRHE